MAIDLHVHTTASDGTFTPDQVVQEAIKIGLDCIAITDHDTIAGIEPAKKKAEGRIMVIPGIEINTDYHERELHILGYFIDCRDKFLLRELSRIHELRRQRIASILDKLHDIGYEITMADVETEAGGGSIGRPHIARALVKKAYVNSTGQAFSYLIGRNGPAYVPRYDLQAAEAVSLIRQAGGIAVWAHPGHTQGDEMLPELIAAGLQGIEVYYPDHSKTQIEHYKKLADNNGLLMTGGTDFHGDITKNKYWLGAMDVPDEVLPALLQAASGSKL